MHENTGKSENYKAHLLLWWHRPPVFELLLSHVWLSCLFPRTIQVCAMDFQPRRLLLGKVGALLSRF